MNNKIISTSVHKRPKVKCPNKSTIECTEDLDKDIKVIIKQVLIKKNSKEKLKVSI